ncbi:MAG: hypothetical protein ABJP90_16225 [Paracoccaceae bacterium]
MTRNLAELETAVNGLTKEGKILDSIEQYYAEGCTFTESDGSSRNSKAEQTEFLGGFFSSLTSFDGATLHGEATGDDFSASEWTFNMTGGDGEKIEWNEVLVRTWADGKVSSEKYYQK